MKKMYLSLATIIVAIVLIACNKTDLGTNSPNANTANPKGGSISTTANPVIAFIRGEDTTVKKTHTTYSIYTMWVCNEDGSCATRVHNPFATSGKITTIGRPQWSSNGTTSLCWSQAYGFTYNGTKYSGDAIYNGDITLINGVPTLSNLKLIADPSKAYTAYSYPEWSPNASANEIVFMGTNVTDGSRSIQIVSANGGTPTVLYRDTNYISCYPSFSPDGTQIAIGRQNKSTKAYSILVVNRSDGSIAQTISLSITPSFLNWQREAGSNIIAFSAAVNSVFNIYTIDISQSTPTPSLLRSSSKASCYSPDDSKFVWWWSDGTHVYNISTGTDAVINIYGTWPSWKR